MHLRKQKPLNDEDAARLIALVDEMDCKMRIINWKFYCSAQVRRLLRTERRYADPDEPAWLREKRYDLIAGYGQEAYKADRELREFRESESLPTRSETDRFAIAARLANEHLQLFLLQGECAAILRSKRDYEKWLNQLMRAKRELAAEFGDRGMSDCEYLAKIRNEIDDLDKGLADFGARYAAQESN